MPDQPSAPATLTATVFIPMRNEAAMIETCLASVQANQLPANVSIEILVLDGESNDGSVALVEQVAATDARIVIHPNPRRLQAAAFNRALALARGEYFIRLDAHSLYPPDYLATCLRLLQETGAENVGGVVLAQGTTPFGSAVAAAVSSRFAVGDAQYRVATTAGWVDTIFPGAWRTSTLRALGGMREDWLVNEDYELNTRLRAAGGRIWLTPELRPTYFVRSSLTGLVRQYFRYGFWKVRTLLEHPGSLRWRQLVAPAFVLSLLLTPLLVHLLGPWLGTVHLSLYLLATMAASALTAAQHGLRYMVFLPVIFATIHLSWGTGFLLGQIRWRLGPR